ncbi:MAG: phosphotransacetylase family protein [Planctomycetes bacterium]|nr:phosphotransacetylase family protein [Planctomycetota bacterium]
MIPIFIASLSSLSGKNLICAGLGLKLKKDGYNIGYFKPVGFSPVFVNDILTDKDAVFLSQALEVNEPLQSISPIIFTEDVLNRLVKGETLNIRKKTIEAFDLASSGKDIMIVRGIGRLTCGTCLGFSELDFITEFDAKVIFIDKFESYIEMLDGFLYASKILKEKLLGVVFNLVPPSKLDYMKNTIRPFLKNNGIDTLGIIRKDPFLKATSIRDIMAALNGKILCCEEKADELIEHFVIGAMNLESAMRHFKKIPDKAVITGGDRSDIHVAALETSTKCLILTGDLYPNASILGRAQEMNVPVMVVSDDTATTIEKCEKLSDTIQLNNMSKIQHATEIMEKEIDFKTIYGKLGLLK